MHHLLFCSVHRAKKVMVMMVQTLTSETDTGNGHVLIRKTTHSLIFGSGQLGGLWACSQHQS